MSVVAFHMEAATLARLIGKTHFAMSNEETRYYLRGIHLHVRGDKLCAVATDGLQLARIEAALPAGAEAMPPVTVPRENVGELKKFLRAARGAVEVRVKPDEIEFACGDKTFKTELLDATFPDYERVIPTSNDQIAVVAKRTLTCALTCVEVAAPKIAWHGSTRKNVVLEFNNNELAMLAGDYAEEVVACNYSGGLIALSIGAKQLRNVATKIDGAQIRFEMKDSKTPIVIKDNTDPSVLFMLMPMRD